MRTSAKNVSQLCSKFFPVVNYTNVSKDMLHISVLYILHNKICYLCFEPCSSFHNIQYHVKHCKNEISHILIQY